MGRCCILVLIGLICVTSTWANLDPRGSRPVVPNTRSEKCATQKEWPFCTDDDWFSKCPSGCRIQGLMDKNDHNLVRRVEKIRALLEQHKMRHRSTDQVTKQTYDFLREKLTLEADGENNYLEVAQSLRQRITNMKIHIDRQLKILAALKDKVKDQVDDMRKLEVDLDIKLRSCKGSCRSNPHYAMEHEGYVTLDKQVDQLNSQAAPNVESMGTTYVMKSRPLQGLPVDTHYKSKDLTDGQQKQDVFLNVKTVHLVLEKEGSKSFPATISKVPVCMRPGRKNPNGRQTMKSCQRKSNIGLCTDDDWTFKCPSGCRLQGLITNMEEKSETKLRKTCQTAQVLEDALDRLQTEIHLLYSNADRDLNRRHDSDIQFLELSGELSQNLTRLRQKSARLEQLIVSLTGKVKEQIEELHRIEVDISMKLRACGGSCQAHGSLAIDHANYLVLVQHLDTAVSDTRTVHEGVPHLELQPIGSDHRVTSLFQRQKALTQFKVFAPDLGETQKVDTDDLE